MTTRNACMVCGAIWRVPMKIADGSWSMYEQEFVTFLLLWPWPWPNDLHTNLTHITWRYTGCANINFLRKGSQKTDRQTDALEITQSATHAVSRVINKENCMWLCNAEGPSIRTVIKHHSSAVVAFLRFSDDVYRITTYLKLNYSLSLL